MMMMMMTRRSFATWINTEAERNKGRINETRSHATVKSTAHLSCLVGVLYDISWGKIC